MERQLSSAQNLWTGQVAKETIGQTHLVWDRVQHFGEVVVV
jgi:hypothetical protein